MVNYRVIIQKEYYEDGTPVYTADCPTLHVHDYGSSIEVVLKRIRAGIKLALECLSEDEKRIPVDREIKEKSFVVNTQVPLELPKDIRLVPSA